MRYGVTPSALVILGTVAAFGAFLVIGDLYGKFNEQTNVSETTREPPVKQEAERQTRLKVLNELARTKKKRLPPGVIDEIIREVREEN